MGTSAGALAGSLYAAGYPPDEVRLVGRAWSAPVVPCQGTPVSKLLHDLLPMMHRGTGICQLGIRSAA
jgi:predicted acylesterase/phospholipase RssA